MTNKRIAVTVAAVLTIVLNLTSLWLAGDVGAGVLPCHGRKVRPFWI